MSLVKAELNKNETKSVLYIVFNSTPMLQQYRKSHTNWNLKLPLCVMLIKQEKNTSVKL